MSSLSELYTGVAELSQALADLHAGCYLNCLLGKWILTELSTAILNVVELSQALADLYAG